MTERHFQSAFTEELSPGSNLPDPAGASLWRFLLPDMAPANVAITGAVPTEVEASFRRTAAHCTRSDGKPPHADLLVVGHGGSGPAEPGGVVCWLDGGRALVDPLVLRPGNLAGPVEASALAVPQQRASSRIPGRLRSKALAAARLLAARIRPSAGAAHPSDLRLLSPQRPGGRQPPANHVVLEGVSGALPPYLCELAARHGVDLRDAHWAIAPPRGFRSQKVLFMCSTGDDAFAIKITQEPRFNVRLAREEAALRALAGQPVGRDGVVPQVVFSGLHAGLLVVGETRLGGAPFRRHTSGNDDCPQTAKALGWLGDLGAATVHRSGENGEQFGAALGMLLNHYESAYRPTPEELTSLRKAITRIADASPPAVRSHGDPGTWNLLVDDEGRIGFLDWENSDERGLPLWDTLLFLDGVGRLRADLGGKRYTPARALELFGGRLATTAVANYCSHLEIDEQLWAPLAATCWMYQAVKEATRAPAGRLQDSHSRQVTAALLAHC